MTTNARVWFEIAGEAQASRRPAPQASSLSQLVAIASVSEAVAFAVTQGNMHSHYSDMSVQISAAVTEAAVYARAGKLNLYAMAGYLYEVIAVINALEFMNGLGEPNDGDSFQHGHTSFAEDITTLLYDATAIDTEWSGEGADGYNTQNQQQQDRVITMAGADQHTAELLANQAFQVTQGRQGLAGIRLAVFGGILVAWAIIKIILSTGLVAEASSLYQVLKSFVEHVAYVAATAAFGLIVTLLIEGIKMGQKFEGALNKYKSISEDVLANIPEAGSNRTQVVV